MWLGLLLLCLYRNGFMQRLEQTCRCYHVSDASHMLLAFVWYNCFGFGKWVCHLSLLLNSTIAKFSWRCLSSLFEKICTCGFHLLIAHCFHVSSMEFHTTFWTILLVTRIVCIIFIRRKIIQFMTSFTQSSLLTLEIMLNSYALQKSLNSNLNKLQLQYEQKSRFF